MVRDYKFVNNSSAAIGIRASYYNQTCTVSIYGIPVLEDGVTHSLKSTKLSEMDPPAPTYEEDPTLAPGAEKVKSNGSKGSKWETRLIVAKNGEVVSQDVDHSVTYKGHTPVILRNSTGTTADGNYHDGDSSAASSAELTGETTVHENHKTSESATTAASHGAAADKTSGRQDHSGRRLQRQLQQLPSSLFPIRPLQIPATAQAMHRLLQTAETRLPSRQIRVSEIEIRLIEKIAELFHKTGVLFAGAPVSFSDKSSTE